MISFRTLIIAATAASFSLTASNAQPATHHDAHHPQAVPAADMAKPTPMQDSAAPMARMDEQMKTMQAMHEKMMQAKTPEQRNAMMAEHMKVMQESMAMMGGMGSGTSMGAGNMQGMPDMSTGGMQGKPAMGAKMDGSMAGKMDGKMCDGMGGAMGMQHQMMEKRMQMMQSMMQMMMDRMPTAPAKH